MDKLRIGIIGLGGIAVRRPPTSANFALLGLTDTPHTHASVYATMPEVEVVAGCDIVPDQQMKFVQIWKDVWPNLRTYGDVRQMFDREKLDIVSICTPSHLHAQVFVDSCEAGVRAIYCEKPLATSIADVNRMVFASEKHGTITSIAHWTRWAPETVLAKEAVRNGTIGSVKRIVQTGGGRRAMLFQNGTYYMDTIAHFADSDPVEVHGDLDPEFDNYGPRYAGDGGASPALDPGAGAMIRFANGVRGFYNFSQGTVDYSETFVVGDKGWLRFSDVYGLEIAVHDSGTGTFARTTRKLSRIESQGMHAGARELVRVLQEGGRTSSPILEARRSVEMMIGVLQSHARGGIRVKMPLSDE